MLFLYTTGFNVSSNITWKNQERLFDLAGHAPSILSGHFILTEAVMSVTSRLSVTKQIQHEHGKELGAKLQILQAFLF